MPVNRDKPDLWKADVARSVDMYNDWFMRFAPEAFRATRITTTKEVEETLLTTRHLRGVELELLREHPEVLPTLRMSTCPPLAVDRLIGLAGVKASLVKTMEKKKRLPIRMSQKTADLQLAKIVRIITSMADPDIFVWLGRTEPPTDAETHRAATIVADRLCGSVANPIIRNAQEKRQLEAIKAWLEARGYRQLPAGEGTKFDAMPPGTFSFRLNIPIRQGGELDQEEDDVDERLEAVSDGDAETDEAFDTVNIPIDAVVMPKGAVPGSFPLLFEAKSAGDYANTNKRRKEEAVKMAQLRATYGNEVQFNLFLCGYFDTAYLGYEAAEFIDWVWEHRIDDLALFGI